MTPICDGADSNFALEQSLMIFVLWPSAITNLDRIVCILVVSQPLEALRR